MDDPPTASKEAGFQFGTFRLLANRGVLLDGDQLVRLGSRAVALLTLLVERAGETVTTQDILARVWPTTTVLEDNIKVQIGGLRRALAGGYGSESVIATIAGQGYRFAAPVEAIAGAIPAYRRSGLPAGPPQVIGRAAAVAFLNERLTKHRLATVVGAGGVGKTAVALAVARDAPEAASFVDLSILSDPQSVAFAVAGALGFPVTTSDVIGGIVGHFANRRALLVLDNCEHVVEACAELAEALLAGSPDIRILATSREPLRVAGELVYRLDALESPPGAPSSLADARRFSAVELFLDRATPASGEPAFDDADAPLIAQLCRQLDGIPLAIELAAALARRRELREVGAAVLGDDPAEDHLGSPGRPRHATLDAAMDWSYRRLPDQEQRLLRRLAVFGVAFSLNSAAAVASEPGEPREAVLAGLLALAQKSLVNVDLGSEEPSYRLLQTTRAFAASKLADEEARMARRRHAEYQRARLRECDALWSPQDRARWLTVYGEMIDDIRAGLDWALEVDDLDLAADLIVESLPAWYGLSLSFEGRERAQRVLERMATPEPRLAELRVRGVHAIAMNYSLGATSLTAGAWAVVDRIARAHGDLYHQLLATWGLWGTDAYAGRYREAAARAEEFARLAEQSGAVADKALATFMAVQPAFCTGRLTTAQREVDRALTLFAEPGGSYGLTRFQFDPIVSARALRSRILWARGFADQAVAEAQACVRDARNGGHGLSISFALLDAAAQIALLTGDLAGCHAVIDEHRRVAHEFGLGARTLAANTGLLAGLRVAQGDAEQARELLASALDPRLENRVPLRFTGLIGQYAEGLADLGETDAARDAIDRALVGHAKDPDHWCRPELLRARALIRLRTNGAEDPGVEVDLGAGLRQARVQGSLAWELRIAITHAEWRMVLGQPQPAAMLLKQVLARVREGFATSDFRRAAALREQFEPGVP